MSVFMNGKNKTRKRKPCLMKNKILMIMVLMSGLMIQACGGVVWDESLTKETEICPNDAPNQITKVCDVYRFVAEYVPDRSQYCSDDYILTADGGEPADRGENQTSGTCEKCEVIDEDGNVLIDGEEAVALESDSEDATLLCEAE